MQRDSRRRLCLKRDTAGEEISEDDRQEVILLGKEQNKRMMEYVMDQLSGLSDVRQIPMMGGYIFYYKERIFGGIYGSGELLIKITETSKKYMPDSDPQLPYEGTKEMLPCTILEDREKLQSMVTEMWEELPERKKKGSKCVRNRRKEAPMVEKVFQDFIRYAEDKKLFIEGIAIADEKEVLLEHHFMPDQVRNTYSHTKSYMSTAAGIAISQGQLALDTRFAEFFAEYIPDGADPRLEKITLEHLLTMSSGFGQPYLMGDDRRAGTGMPDYIAYMMGRPVLYEPGSRFAYSTADSILAGRMIEKAVGRNLAEYLYRHVFSKLGQGWPIWENDPAGHPIGGGSMYMKLTDMMKLGQVYLADGMWRGERIVDSGWVKAATTKQIETEPVPPKEIWWCGYGYQFWLSPYPRAYRADGAFGQVSTVLPEKGLVVAVQCPEYGDFDQVKRALHEQIFTQL
ncbi:MAG TPA: hypothetical protein DF613_09925 [Lachnospiraceae bacterium]|nr:hypothetical protein [Lachnospiraceae bacterium]